MKLIIAGSRTVPTEEAEKHIKKWMLSEKIGEIGKKGVTEIVSGTCRGVDEAGENVGHALGLEVSHFPADWDEYGKAAGPIRNGEMAEYADALLLIWDGKSRGSASMKRNMVNRNKPVYEVII